MMLFQDSFVTLQANTVGRDFIVGDIHGRLDRLTPALKAVAFDGSADRLIAVGDVIDRGPDGAALLRMLRDQPWFLSVVGNHEAIMQAAVRGDQRAARDWQFFDNDWAAELEEAELRELTDIIDGMPLALELPLPNRRRVGIVHAEVQVGRSWQDLTRARLQPATLGDLKGASLVAAALWGRSRLNAVPIPMKLSAWHNQSAPAKPHPSTVPGIDLVVSGHTLVDDLKTPHLAGNCLCIETGAFLGNGRLTLLEIATGRYWQVGGSPVQQIYGPSDLDLPTMVRG
jgi:serine/threonine protein phosphatase 1